MPKIVDHEVQKRIIALKALELFKNESYFNVGMRDLARELSMSKTKIYHYFPSKKDLISYSFNHLKNVAIGFSYSNHQASTSNLVKYYASVVLEYKYELYLLLDYLRDSETNTEEVYHSLLNYKKIIISELAKYLDTSIKKARQVYCAIVGSLVVSALTNTPFPQGDVKEMIKKLC